MRCYTVVTKIFCLVFSVSNLADSRSKRMSTLDCPDGPLAAARSAAAYGDDFTAFLCLHTLITLHHLLHSSFLLKILKETW